MQEHKCLLRFRCANRHKVLFEQKIYAFLYRFLQLNFQLYNSTFMQLYIKDIPSFFKFQYKYLSTKDIESGLYFSLLRNPAVESSNKKFLLFLYLLRQKILLFWFVFVVIQCVETFLNCRVLLLNKWLIEKRLKYLKLSVCFIVDTILSVWHH